MAYSHEIADHPESTLACSCRDLADPPFAWFGAWLFGAEYDKVVIAVHDRVEWNYMGWKWGPAPPFYMKCGVYRCFEYGVSQKILNAYLNGVRGGKCPEFGLDPTKLYSKELKERNWWDITQLWGMAADQSARDGAAVAYVAKAAGVTQQMANWHLFELYWASHDGTLPTGRLWLWPKLAEKFAEARETPRQEDSVFNIVEDVKEAVGDAVDFTKWLLIGGLVVGGLYFGSKVVSPLINKKRSNERTKRTKRERQLKGLAQR